MTRTRTTLKCSHAKDASQVVWISHTHTITGTIGCERCEHPLDQLNQKSVAIKSINILTLTSDVKILVSSNYYIKKFWCQWW